jgi:hypothetical protein
MTSAVVGRVGFGVVPARDITITDQIISATAIARRTKPGIRMPNMGRGAAHWRRKPRAIDTRWIAGGKIRTPELAGCVVIHRC